MPLDIKRLTEKYKQIQNESKKYETSKYIWKPKEGLQKIRIVPCKSSPDYPLIELKFYYNMNKRTYLAPSFFGKPDPIAEFVEKKLLSSGLQADKELAKKLTPQLRNYIPIIVRKEEDVGVRFWGFGTQVLKQLMPLLLNQEMWGDITSIMEGNDLQVEFHKVSAKKTKDGNPLPETIITPDPRKTPVVDPSNKELLQKIKDQIDILSIWSMPEYDELKDALDKHLNGGEDSNGNEENATEDDTSAFESTFKEPSSGNVQKVDAFEDFFKS